MKNFKSHFFMYSKQQRDGIFFLVLFIVIFQLATFIYKAYSKTPPELKLSTKETQNIQHQFDSIKNSSVKLNKITSFNPNFITDYKGYKLGMTLEEIGKLHQYRKQNKWINSIEEFKRVTQINDSTLNKISPFFKFPEWIIKKNKTLKTKAHPTVGTINLNKATEKDLAKIRGINSILASRIVKYRKRIQGFTYKNQLFEVWGLQKKQVSEILKIFQISKSPDIKKININTATFKEVLKIPYIDYQICKRIFNYRDEVAEIQDINELKNIEGITLHKYKLIKLYLFAK